MEYFFYFSFCDYNCMANGLDWTYLELSGIKYSSNNEHEHGLTWLSRMQRISYLHRFVVNPKLQNNQAICQTILCTTKHLSRGPT